MPNSISTRPNWPICNSNKARACDTLREELAMKTWHLVTALAASLMVMAAPCAAQKRPPPPKPSISTPQGKAPGSSSRTGASRGQVSSGKAVARRGKPSLRAQKENMVRLIGRAEGLKPQRFQLRQQAIRAQAAYRANPNAATRAASREAMRAYLPVRQAHELARGQRDAAIARYRLTKSQRLAAIKASSQAAATPPRLPPQPGRPALRRQAAVRQLAVRPAAVASPQMLYPTAASLPPPRVQPLPGGNGHYFSSASAFKAGMSTQTIYDRFPPPSTPPASPSSTGNISNPGGTAGSFGSQRSVQLNRMDSQPFVGLQQNAAGGN
jgi:hypothetical protein